MRRNAKLAAVAASTALLWAAGCGGSDEEEPEPGIPRDAAERLSRELDLVQERIDVTREQSEPGSCRDVELKSYPDIQEIVEGLPDDTDPDVRRALERSIDRLKELTDSECRELTEEIEQRQEETTPEPTPPPAPAPTPTPEPPRTETQPEEEPPPDEKKPDKDGDQQDDGDGDGGGQGPDGQGPPGQGGGGQPAPPAQGE